MFLYRFNNFFIKVLLNYCIIKKIRLTHVYGTDSCVEDRSNYLIEALLNTPDLIENNTPLHYACKFGYLEIARILLSYPKCKRYSINK